MTDTNDDTAVDSNDDQAQVLARAVNRANARIGDLVSAGKLPLGDLNTVTYDQIERSATPVADKASTIRRRFDALRSGLDADDELTPEAKAGYLEALNADCKAALARVASADRQAATAELGNLERYVFAPPPLPVTATQSDKLVAQTSWRDAIGRARDHARSAVDGRVEMGSLIQDAWRFGDEALAKAALAVAVEHNDINAMNVWIERHPKDEPRLQRLVDLRGADPVRAEVERGLVFHL